MSENSKIGNYTIGPKIKSGAFGIDTILLKHQIKDEIKYYEGRLLKIKEKKPQNSARTILKARQSLFNEMKIMDQLRTDHRFQKKIEIIKDDSKIILVCEKLMDSVIDSSEFHFVNLLKFVQLTIERQQRVQSGRAANVSTIWWIGERKAISLFSHISNAVNYLHENYIVHRNLTLENIVFDPRSETIKISKFGLAIKCTNENNLLTDNLVLMSNNADRYLAPDILIKKPYLGKPIDCWAMGIILYHLLYSTFPFNHENKKNLHSKIITGDFLLPIEKGISENCSKLLRKLLHIDHRMRATSSFVEFQISLMRELTKKTTLSVKKDGPDQVVPHIAPITIKQTELNLNINWGKRLCEAASESVPKALAPKPAKIQCRRPGVSLHNRRNAPVSDIRIIGQPRPDFPQPPPVP